MTDWLVGIAFVIALLLLMFGGPLERTVHRVFGGKSSDDAQPD